MPVEFYRWRRWVRAFIVQLDGDAILPEACTCASGERLTCPIDDHRAKYLQETADWSN
jgi:hypothetical protein